MAVIFGSGTCSPKTKLYKSAFDLGKFLAEKGYNIANGGYFGVMEASAKGASYSGVQRIGVVFKNYNQNVNKYITKIIETSSYIDRLNKLIEIGDLFFIFEGETGTLLEFAALLALSKRRLSQKNVFCIGKQWKKLNRFLYRNIKGFKKSEINNFFFVENIEEIRLKLTL